MNDEILQSIIALAQSALWPCVAVFAILQLKSNLRDLLLKHGSTEVRLSLHQVGEKKEKIAHHVRNLEDTIKQFESEMNQSDIERFEASLTQISELTSEIANLKEDLLGSLSSVAESGTSTNGKYAIYNNGLLTFNILLGPGKINGRTWIPFPVVLADDSASVTFIGREQPTVTRLRKEGMFVELPSPNTGEVQVVIYGVGDF